jgi:predicted aldo/keto reductase-like oxidoreductase
MGHDDHKTMNRREFLKLGAATAAVTAAGLGGASSLFGAEGTGGSPELVYRTLGRTGLKVTVVSFGAMLTPEYEVIRAGLEQGINYVDTARRYLGGRSEDVVGKALKGLRDKVYVATKIDPNSTTKKDIFADVETSLTKLGTDHVDVIQLHSLKSGTDRAFSPEIREALLELRKQGKVRFFGVTTHTNQADVLNAVAADPTKFFDTVLVAYNFKSDQSLKDAVANAAKTGLGIVAMKTQAGGYKTDALGAVSPHQAALKWALQDKNVSCAIPGMKDMQMLKEMTSVMGMKLTARDERILNRYADAIDPYYCRLCGQCEPTCPNGVAISVINRALMYAEGYGELKLARVTYTEVGQAHSASLCAGCTECTAQCVHGLDIAGKMRQARTLLA